MSKSPSEYVKIGNAKYEAGLAKLRGQGKNIDQLASRKPKEAK